MSNSSADVDHRIWLVVSRIPPGKVATYGDVAMMAGLPGAARRVGAALRRLPTKTEIPWHRVINAKGEIVVPGGAQKRTSQRQKLEAEGICFKAKNRLELKSYRWL
ncbi:MAG: MGMT family protein [Pseudomonadota bacterium]